MDKYIRVDIVDNDNSCDGDRVMDTYILVNPSMEKLKELQEKLDNRQDEENEFCGDYGNIYDYITENFEVLEMSGEIVEIEW